MVNLNFTIFVIKIGFKLCFLFYFFGVPVLACKRSVILHTHVWRCHRPTTDEFLNCLFTLLFETLSFSGLEVHQLSALAGLCAQGYSYFYYPIPWIHYFTQSPRAWRSVRMWSKCIPGWALCSVPVFWFNFEWKDLTMTQAEISFPFYCWWWLY